MMKTADALALIAEALDRNTKVMEDMAKLTQSIDEFRAVLSDYPRKTREALVHGRAAAAKSSDALRQTLQIHQDMMGSKGGDK